MVSSNSPSIMYLGMKSLFNGHLRNKMPIYSDISNNRSLGNLLNFGLY